MNEDHNATSDRFVLHTWVYFFHVDIGKKIKT